MNRNKSSLIIYVLLGLAVLGLIYTLQYNAASFIRSVLIGAAVIGIIYLIYNRFIMKSNSSKTGKERQAYRKAARISSKKHKQDTMKPRKSKHHKTHGLTVISKETLINKPKKKSNIQLTVIEGKKARKKNRALF